MVMSMPPFALPMVVCCAKLTLGIVPEVQADQMLTIPIAHDVSTMTELVFKELVHHTVAFASPCSVDLVITAAT